MSKPPPWRDALHRAARPSVATTAIPTAPAPTAAAVRASASKANRAAVSPRLAALIAERERLQASVTALTAGSTSDPRYAVATMAERRAEFARWSSERDSRRPEPRAVQSEPLRAGHSAGLHPQLAFPPLRATPGEAVPAGSVPMDPRQWMASRDASGARSMALRGDDIGARQARSSTLRGGADSLAEVGRALRAVGSAERAVTLPREPGGRQQATPENRAGERLRGAAAPLERGLERARDWLSVSRKVGARAKHALGRAHSAIQDDWEERARERIPGLGRADPYVRETARKLTVAVGTVDELTEKADQMREQAQAIRELEAADAAGDDERRERALERLKVRRAEGSS